jgi:hypothetical protein
MSSLYQVNKEIERVLYEEMDITTGEISAEGVLLLDALEIDSESLALQRARYCKELRARATMIMGVVKERKDQADLLNRRAGLIEANLQQELEDGTKYQDEFVELTWRKSTAVGITGQVAPEYMRQPATPAAVPDKVGILKALKDGKKVEGAEIHNRNTLTVK